MISRLGVVAAVSISVLAAAGACSVEQKSETARTRAVSPDTDYVPGRRDTTIVLTAPDSSTLNSLVAYVGTQPGCASVAPDTLPNAIHLKATASGEMEPEFFCFAAHGATYGIAADGSAIRMARSQPPVPFRVRLDSVVGIERVMYGFTPENLYLYYQVTDGESGMGYLDRLAAADLAPAWRTPASVSFNLGPALLLGDSIAYVSGAEVVGKLNLRTGSYVWRHIMFGDDKQAAGVPNFTSFLLPELRGDTVRFPPWPAGTTRIDTLVIDDRTGSVLAPAALHGRTPICPRNAAYC